MNRFCFPLAITLMVASLAAARPALAHSDFPARIAGPGDYLGLSPFWDWKTLETPHFLITFPAELADIAQKTARYYEEAHHLLSPVLKWSPERRTQIILVDNTDLANGLTSAVLRFGMVLMVTPPENWFSTAYYDDWLRLLVIHEYAHFLNMDVTKGVWEVLRYIFGDSLLPNSLWPSWMLEGLAVYMETRFTNSGRGRSPYYEMVLRAAVERGLLDSSRYITLDKINGRNPYPPGGETAYLFGYHLLNQASRSPLHPDFDEVLGEMSYRSGSRFPFFINGNLENITGKDWYGFWDEWVAETTQRMNAQLARIRSQPLSKLEPITRGMATTLGSSISPDGRWMVYTQSSPIRRMGLFIRDMKSGEVTRLSDKFEGATLEFTPDSTHFVYSSVARRGKYNLWSDLAVYDVKNRSSQWLSDSLRARDPTISRDGHWIAFTLTEHAITGVGIARLERDGDEFKLGEVRKLCWPSAYDRAATPRFSPDGKSVVFSLHANGRRSEELMRVSIGDGTLETLVSNGKMNRFPVFSGGGKLHFVSDLTGVDNIYELPLNPGPTPPTGSPILVTNVTTGLAFPMFHGETLYANAYTPEGWNIARVGGEAPRLPPGQALEKVGVSAPSDPSRKKDAESLARAAAIRESTPDYPVEDYSVFPSLLPRQWAPLLLLGEKTSFIGGQILGFDTTDVHRYVAAAYYESATKKLDFGVNYSNRQLGPVLTLSAEHSTSSELFFGNSLTEYTRTNSYGLSVSHPIQWTYSSLTPILSLGTEREWVVAPGSNPSDSDIVARRPYIPEVSGLLVYSDAESSNLAISPERGRTALLGSRAYFDSGHTIWKHYIQETEYWHLFSHTVLVPSIKAMATTSASTASESPQVVSRGRRPRLIDPLQDDPFKTLAIRGYPGQRFISRSVGVGSLDYRFPLWRIFRGWGTNPVFLENLHGFVFGETAWFPAKEPGTALLPSGGLGLRTNMTTLTYIPLFFSLEFHRGFRQSAGGESEIFLQLGLGDLGI